MARRRRKATATERANAALLRSRGWRYVGDGMWRLRGLSDPWPTVDAAALEREDATPVSERKHPWRDVEGISAAALIEKAKAMLAETPKAAA